MCLIKIIKAFILYFIFIVVIFIAFLWFSTPSVLWLRDRNPIKTAMMSFREKDGVNFNKNLPSYYTFVPLSQIADNLQKSVLFSEDLIFFKHKGFNWNSIIKNVKEYFFKKNKKLAGGSTITQQLAKNLFLKPSRSWIRKIREAFITIQLEKNLSKLRILELYLNLIEWGPGIYGAQDAALFYYQKPALVLSAEESIRLTSIIPNPYKLKPDVNFFSINRRRNEILEYLLRKGFISTETFQELKRKFK